MKWSKLKQLVEQGFAESVRKRLSINSAAYGACTCGHAWLTLDGTVVANFCTRASGNLAQLGEKPTSANKMYASQFMNYGEMSRQDAYKACWEFVHDLSIEEALKDDDPLIQTLAVVDRRTGKRRLTQIDPQTLHPLARKLLEERLEAEGMNPRREAASV
jgi:hypothetical protein